MTPTAGVLVLSPHRDDAAFSCGLLLERLQHSGVPIRIANICTISSYAPYAEEADTNSITSLRAREDEVFTALLRQLAPTPAPPVELLDLAWNDAPLRLRMPAEDVLVQEEVSADEVSPLAQQFSTLPPASVVLAPLALGGHLDHRLVHLAAISAWHPGQLLFYDDQPYICRIPKPERAAAIEAALPWPSSIWQTPPSHRGIKRRMALCYNSQVASEVAVEMELYAEESSFTESVHGTADALRGLAAMFSMELADR